MSMGLLTGCWWGLLLNVLVFSCERSSWRFLSSECRQADVAQQTLRDDRVITGLEYVTEGLIWLYFFFGYKLTWFVIFYRPGVSLDLAGKCQRHGLGDTVSMITMNRFRTCRCMMLSVQSTRFRSWFLSCMIEPRLICFTCTWLSHSVW